MSGSSRSPLSGSLKPYSFLRFSRCALKESPECATFTRYVLGTLARRNRRWYNLINFHIRKIKNIRLCIKLSKLCWKMLIAVLLWRFVFVSEPDRSFSKRVSYLISGNLCGSVVPDILKRTDRAPEVLGPLDLNTTHRDQILDHLKCHFLIFFGMSLSQITCLVLRFTLWVDSDGMWWAETNVRF